jgi:hypothetical protein
MAKTAYPRFKASRIYKHTTLGRVKMFDFTADGEMPGLDAAGAQTDFYLNGAEINNPKQFGIKLFSTSIEAFAAYQRQRLAARAGCAPTVGCVVQFKCGRWSRWGYETGIADTSPLAKTIALVLGHPMARKNYNAWAKWAGVSSSVACMADNIERFRIDSNWSLIYQRDEQGKMIQDGWCWKKRPVEELVRDPRLVYKAINDDYCAKWDIEPLSLSEYGSTLRKRLLGISLTGTQYDNLFELHDDGDCSFARDPRLYLGSKLRKSDKATMGGDLHDGNIGLWRNRAVCIDFGFHCVVSNLAEAYID